MAHSKAHEHSAGMSPVLMSSLSDLQPQKQGKGVQRQRQRAGQESEEDKAIAAMPRALV